MTNKAVFLVENRSSDFDLVFPDDLRKRISSLFGVSDIPVLCKEDLVSSRRSYGSVEFIFSTWNMPVLSEADIERFFPSVRHLFYAAGTVKYFAPAFIRKGIKVHSAADVNAVPVAEYASALIALGAKGFYRSRISKVRHFFAAKNAVNTFPGNYGAIIGILGLGRIGRLVASRLVGSHDFEVLGYDPYVDASECAEIGVRKADIDELFSSCDVISNHMPDLPETRRVISKELLGLMKPTAVFVNTARGAQVDERALANVLKRNKLQTAVLDVTSPEPIRPWNPLLRCRNAYITPHIAGSLGNEKRRLGEAMLEECRLVLDGGQVRFEVRPSELERSA